MRATIAQRAPYASPQQVEQIANAVQSRLGSAALTPEADAVINDVLAVLGASGVFNQPAPTNQPPGYAPYSPYPQYPGAQQYPYPQSQYPGAQSPYPYQPTQPQYPYRNAQSPPQQGYPLPNAFNYIPQQPTQGWGAPGQGTPPAFPYAQPPQAPPYYSQQGYAQPPQQNYQQPQAPQPNAPFSYGAAYNARSDESGANDANGSNDSNLSSDANASGSDYNRDSDARRTERESSATSDGRDRRRAEV